MDYGQLCVITPPTHITLSPEYTLRFAWPRPPETGSLIQTADEKFPDDDGPLWLGATSDYDPDRVELKLYRDSLGADALLSGLICIERTPPDLDPDSQDDADAEGLPDTYLVLWGLRKQNGPSTHHVDVSHGETYPDSAWCCVVAWEDVLDPSLAPLANEILQLDLASILTSIQETLQLTRNDFKERWRVIRSSPGSAAEVTARIECLDFFGQETLQIVIGSSHADQ